ncbi:Acetyltransferase (GNAT) family protein [Babesia bovis T2Bo]|uniref:Acetyltransferase (GNAT) family protein n=1 Tax=Babesia bovis T2Bo TaxID=484906 RepID=UPI001C356E63|nr:Acetyltransferase (GNAT) family protein [Babesia bovis T2Bo]KAG6440104.1 Acetyltransferase (GNAT) family protein [Babesia bovis T2Bo]
MCLYCIYILLYRLLSIGILVFVLGLIHLFGYTLSYSLSGCTEIDNNVVYGHVSSLIVLPQFRRRKFATELMLEFERVCREELNCAYVNFFVNPLNEVALSLYNKLGYQVHCTLPKYYNSTDDAYEMRKSLISPTEPL